MNLTRRDFLVISGVSVRVSHYLLWDWISGRSGRTPTISRWRR